MTAHRPYDSSVLDEVRQMAARGATTLQLADHFGVPVSSIELWAACHEEFAAALKLGRAVVDDRVERAFYERCVGFVHESEKVQYDAGGEGRPAGWVRTPIRQHHPPDGPSCAAWLRNRRPEEWNDKQLGEAGAGGEMTVTIRRVGPGEK